MNIVFGTYPYAFQVPGGGEIQLLQYQKYLDELDFNVDLFNQWSPNLKKYSRAHFFSCIAGSEHFLAFLKSMGIPVFISPNLWVTSENKNLYPYDSIRLQFSLANKIVCNSKAECELLSQVFDTPRDKFLRVYNGVDEIFFQKIDQKIFRNHFEIEDLFILNVANIEPRKNQLNLAKAMKNFPNYKLVIMGDIRDRDYANQLILEGGEQLIIIKRQDHGSELHRSAYAACSLFALPSTLETPGLAALEAGACGASVLITSEGCTKEYFDEYATYVEHNSVSSIANGIEIALLKSNSELPALVRRLYTWREVLKPLARYYTGKEFFGDSIKADGFYLVETLNDQRKFVWSKYRAYLEFPNGVINFQWRAPQMSLVDICLNDELYQSKIKLGEVWESMAISTLGSSKAGMQRVEFRINPIEPVKHGDAREIGVGLLSLEFKKSM